MSPGARRRALIRARFECLETRMRARCWHGSFDEDAGEIELIHPDTRARIARIDVVAMTAALVPGAERYRPGIEYMLDLAKRGTA